MIAWRVARGSAFRSTVPSAPLASWPEHLLDTAPLYAGESVARIHDIRPAADLVRLLAG